MGRNEYRGNVEIFTFKFKKQAFAHNSSPHLLRSRQRPLEGVDKLKNQPQCTFSSSTITSKYDNVDATRLSQLIVELTKYLDKTTEYTCSFISEYISCYILKYIDKDKTKRHLNSWHRPG